MNQTFIKDLDALLHSAIYSTENGNYKYLREKFIQDYQQLKGQIYVPEIVANWFNSEYVKTQREKGMSVGEVFIDIDNNEYDLFTESGIFGWDEVLTWVEEHDKDFILLWFGEDYKMLVEQELYYLWNPFEQGYSRGGLGYTTDPEKEGYKYTWDEVAEMSEDLAQFLVRIDEV